MLRCGNLRAVRIALTVSVFGAQCLMHKRLIQTGTKAIAAIAILLALCPVLSAEAGAVKRGARATERGVKKGVRVTEGGTKKGLKETEGGVKKAVKVTD